MEHRSSMYDIPTMSRDDFISPLLPVLIPSN